MSAVRTLADPDGSLIVRKVATDDVAVTRLRREARALQLASHPGVVSIVRYTEGEEGTVATLDTRFVGTHTLATLRCRTPVEVAQTIAAVADTLADLHGVGVIHGAIHPSHLVLDQKGDPVLCGWADGGLLGETLPYATPTATVTSGPNGPVLRPSRDVYALGRLLHHLCDPDRCGFDPRSRRHRAAVERLADLATLASAHDPALRPSARAVADRLRAITLGEATIIGEATTTTMPTHAASAVSATNAASADAPSPLRTTGPRRGRPPHRGRPATIRKPAIAAALLLSTLFAGANLRPHEPEADAAPAASASASPATVTSGMPPTPHDPAPHDPALHDPAPHDAAPVDVGNTPPGICEAVLVPITPPYPAPACTASAPAPQGLLVGDLRYRLGEPTDEILIADWRCLGTPQVAVLRTPTGEVHEFTSWASPGVPVRSIRLVSLPQGSHLETGPIDPSAPPGCLALTARQPDGHTSPIVTPQGAP